jgi:heme oxygenase
MTVSSPSNSPANTTPVVRTVLRQATHEHHNQLNRHSMLAGLTQPDYTINEYQKLLCAYVGLYQALEQLILSFLSDNETQFDYRPRLKSAWLLQDLAYFHIEPDSFSHASQALNIKNRGDLIGILYVIEGSTLGGQLISKHLAKNLGITPETGGRFFGGYGENTATFWTDFLHFAANLDGNESECMAAKNSACQTFQLFLQTLDDFSAYTAQLHQVK